MQKQRMSSVCYGHSEKSHPPKLWEKADSGEIVGSTSIAGGGECDR